MHMTELADTIKDYGRDIRLNLSSVLSEEGAPGLSKQQIWGVALACAYYTKNEKLVGAIQSDAAAEALSPEYIEASKAAATIMAMNNVYYRFLHLSDDKNFSKMPARLRMNVIAKPGIEKKDFELMSLAVSALAGCGMCINSHVNEVAKAGISSEGSQSAVRIASVINAAAQALSIN
jgi:alkyl hydroperoxide reductase subunit D